MGRAKNGQLSSEPPNVAYKAYQALGIQACRRQDLANIVWSTSRDIMSSSHVHGQNIQSKLARVVIVWAQASQNPGLTSSN